MFFQHECFNLQFAVLKEASNSPRHVEYKRSFETPVTSFREPCIPPYAILRRDQQPGATGPAVLRIHISGRR